MKTLTIIIYGSYSIAECVPMSKNKLRIKKMASDASGEKLLKRAVAAYNRGESSVVKEGWDEIPFFVKDGESGLF